MTKTTRIYVWQDEEYHFSFSKMFKNNEKYNPEMNAKNISSMIMNGLPGNTVDILLEIIANSIRESVNSLPETLNQPHHVENCIRCALSELSREDN